MAISEKSRSSLYRGLSAVIDDEEAVSDMLAQFPAREVDESVTKDHLRAELVVVRADMAEWRAEFKSDLAGLRAEVKDEIAELRAEVKDEIAELRAEVKSDIAELDKRMIVGFATISAEMSSEMRRWFLSSMALMVTLAGVAIALARVVPGP